MLSTRGRPRENPIGNTPICKNLAYLFRHPDSGHPVPHSGAGFNIELENIHLEILRLFPGDKKGNMTQKAMVNIIAGRRNPSVVAVIKTCAAYESLYNIKIDPYDLFVDRSKWLNLAHFTPTQQKICRNLSEVKNEKILAAILALTETEIGYEQSKINLHSENSSDTGE